MLYLHTRGSKFALPRLSCVERHVLILSNGQNRLADIIRILGRPAKQVFDALASLRAQALVLPIA